MVLGLAPRRDSPSRPASLVLRAGLHLLGLTGGAVATGATLGGAGYIVSRVVDARLIIAIASMVAIAYGLMDLGLWQLPSAGRHWQVPRVWLAELPLPLTYLLFGILLGLGFLTVAPFGTFTALLAFEFATASPTGGALVGAMYGGGRGLGLLSGQLYIWRAAALAPTTAVPTLIGRMPAWRRVVAVASFCVGAWLIIGVVRGALG